MKKFSFLVLAVAGMLFTACSSEKDVEETPQNPLETAAAGYFKVNVNLPTQVVSSNRAANWEDTNLQDGEDYEYAVDNIMLLLFEGTNEADAQLFQVIDLNSTQANNGDDPNQITTTGSYVAKITKRPATGKQFFAMAVVNGAGVIEHGSAANSLRLAGGTDKTDVKLSDIQGATAKSTSVDANPFVYKKGTNTYFFMTNAVLSKKQGGSADPTADPELQILSPLNADYIYATEDEASATDATAATEIYVERGVAKVTLTTGTDALKTDALTDKTTGSKLSATATIAGWSLDGTNASSFVARKVPADFTWNLKSKASGTYLTYTDPYRFVGANKINGKDLYRTYWAEDPNYNIAWATGNFNSATGYTHAAAEKLYAFENTFTVDQMKTNNTTRAILKVKLTSDGSEFYTIGDDRKTMYSMDDVENKVVDNLFNQSAFINWWNNTNTGGTVSITGADVTVTLDTGAGKVAVTEVTIPMNKFNPAKTADVKVSELIDPVGSDMLAVLNNSLKSVERFEGGYAYYVVRVKHFGDDMTPWNTNEYGTGTKPAEGDVAAIYPAGTDRDNNYLGRYGMVRNNWYDLQLGKILKIGYSEVPNLNGGGSGVTPPGPDDPDHPDDELGLYIMAKIHILSWAKRVQSWQLK